MPSKQNAPTKSSPVRDAPESAEKPKPKGFEPARPKVRPAPKSSQSSRANKKRADRAGASAGAKSARAAAAPPTANPSGQKKVKLSTALRQEGLDERCVARGYLKIHKKLSKSEDKGDLKLFVDVLKENSRVLDPPRPADRATASDEPVTVTLVHNIPRPDRKVDAP